MREHLLKKLFIVSTIFILNFNFQSCTNAQNVSLSGAISGMDKGILVLKNIGADPAKPDSINIKIEKGKINYTSSSIPLGIYVGDIYVDKNIQPVSIPYLIYIEPGTISFSGNINENPTHWSISGTQSNNDLQILKKQGLDSVELLLQEKFKHMNTSSLSDEEKKKMINSTIIPLLQERAKIIATYNMQHPKSLVSLGNCIMLVGSVDPQMITSLFAQLDTSLQNSDLGKQISKSLNINTKPTIAEAPNFTLPTPEGKMVSLSDYKGKYVLVDFWASWCGPCRRENPHVVNAYKMYHPKGFEILGVSLDNDKTNWVEAIRKDGLEWTQVSDLKGWESAAGSLYGIKAIPANFLIDPQGKIIDRDLRGDALEQALEKIFK